MTIVYQSVLNGYPAGIRSAAFIAVRSLAMTAEGRCIPDYASYIQSLITETESLEAVGFGGTESDLDLYLLKCGDHESYDVVMHDVSLDAGKDSVIGTLLGDETFIPGAVIQCALYDYAIEGHDLDHLQARIEEEFRAAIDPDVTEDEARAAIADLREAGGGIFAKNVTMKLFSYTGSSADFLAALPDAAVELFTDIATRAYPEEAVSNISSL